MKLLSTVVVSLGLSGCFSYVPAELGTVASGQEVRLQLNREATDRLIDLGVARATGEPELVAGVLVRRADGALSLRVPLSSARPGMLGTIAQEVPFASGEVLRIDRRRLDGFRTGVAASATVGAAAAAIVLIIRGAEGESKLPGPGGPDDSRVPLDP